MSHHIIEVRNLHYQYPDKTSALWDLSFRIRHGEAVAVIGANGAGKSTLMLHLVGALMPSSGEVYVGENLVDKKNLPRVRNTVGMIFQDPDDQLFMPTVFEDVAFGPLNQGLEIAEVENRVFRALRMVDAFELRDRPPYHLSDGEKKRVAIATVLAMLPKILVLDEPSNGLDPYSRRQLITHLKNFPHTRFIASHDLDMVLELCERTIVLHEGRIAADGPTVEIFQNESLLNRCRLEPPLVMQGCALCQSVASKRIYPK